METLPFVDDNTVLVEGAPDTVWAALRAWAGQPSRGLARRYARLVGVRGETLFDVVREEPPVLLELAGSHRFSRYRLVLTLREVAPGRTSVTGSTYAAFPGIPGTVYRTAVIRTGAHAVVTRGLLRRVARGA